MRQILLALVFLLTISACSFSFAQNDSENFCTLGTLLTDSTLMEERYKESIFDEDVSKGDQLPILSCSSDVCRTIDSTGKDVFVAKVHLKMGAKLNRIGVLKKVIELEKKVRDEDNQIYSIWVRFYDRIAEQSKGGFLPPSEGTERTSADSLPPTVSIENATRYSITVTYSGPVAKSITLRRGETKTITLRAGTFRVSASTTDASVRPYHGTDRLQSNYEYSIQFYIESHAEFQHDDLQNSASLRQN